MIPRFPSMMIVLILSSSILAAPLRIATFQIDATPPIGTPLCDALVPPAKEIVDKLSLRGLVLLTSDKPIVLVAVDWVGIGNSGHDAFREALAKAADTTPDRVAVHCLHQHDAPGCDFSADDIAKQYGHGDKLFDVKFARETIARAAEALREGMKQPRNVTHIGLGSAAVERVASNRRILGPLGRVRLSRMSSCQNEEAIAAPEGVIDPLVRVVSFFDGDKPLAVLSYYATHPQSHYGKGGVTCDFVGLARNQRDAELPGAMHLHFNGAGGNVAAGKYNDGSPPRRAELTGRLAEGMKKAWENTKKTAIAAEDVKWTVERVALPLSPRLEDEAPLVEALKKPDAPLLSVTRAARDLAYLRRVKAKHQIDIAMLTAGPARIVHMPGELFVEYQLEAQKMKPEDFVAMAAYGDYGPGYIGTFVAYEQGGYETGIVSRTAPQVEKVLVDAMKKLLAP